MNQPESFGVRLARLRRDAGLSQQELSQILSVTRQAISNWERDQTVPDLDMLRAIATALDTDLNTLCTVEAVPAVKSRSAPRLLPVLTLSLCAALCLGTGLWLWSVHSAPTSEPEPTFSLPAHRIRYTTADGITVTTDADGALELSDTLSALPKQDPGPVESDPQLTDDLLYFARQYLLRFLPEIQDGTFLSDWGDVLLWCYRSGCSQGGPMEPQVVADYLARFFDYEGSLPSEGTAQFPLRDGCYYPACGPFTTSDDVYTLHSLELLSDGTYRAQLQIEPYHMVLDPILFPSDGGLSILSARKTYDF